MENLNALPRSLAARGSVPDRRRGSVEGEGGLDGREGGHGMGWGAGALRGGGRRNKPVCAVTCCSCSPALQINSWRAGRADAAPTR